jgi:DNA-binding transcriptional LysR family regulator
MHLAPALQAFMKRHEHVEVELNASDRMVDLVEEGYDLAIRITGNPTPTMVARKIGPVRWITCASPAYLKRHGTPLTPQELSDHECLGYLGVPAQHAGWHYRFGGKHVLMHPSGRLRVNNSEVLLQLALDGMGIVMFPTYILGPYLRSGRLKEILTDCVANPDTALYATYMPNRYMQPKVRAFIDHLMEYFGPEPYWDKF